MTAGFVLKFISPDNTLNRMEIRVFAEKFAHFCPAGSLEVQTKEVEKVEKDLYYCHPVGLSWLVLLN